MNLIPWKNKKAQPDDVSRSLATFRREMDNLFERFFREPWGLNLSDFEMGLGPTMEMTESEDQVTLTFELPGVSPEDFEINVSGNVLTLTGEKSDKREDRRGNCFYSERSYGRFSRTVQLPASVDPNKVDANFKNGVLTIKLEKHPGAKPKKIPVQTG